MFCTLKRYSLWHFPSCQMTIQLNVILKGKHIFFYFECCILTRRHSHYYKNSILQNESKPIWSIIVLIPVSSDLLKLPKTYKSANFLRWKLKQNKIFRSEEFEWSQRSKAKQRLKMEKSEINLSQWTQQYRSRFQFLIEFQFLCGSFANSLRCFLTISHGENLISPERKEPVYQSPLEHSLLPAELFGYITKSCEDDNNPCQNNIGFGGVGSFAFNGRTKWYNPKI